ncbi:hypothetical protein RIF29_25384 [Crotalaria pallida]|uniref:Uncharacterized protein n=1 Tax=Crotalaria pallida TaxID=3830 RepID=A0AAN9ENW7_CROPI
MKATSILKETLKRKPSREDIEKVDEALKLNKHIEEGTVPVENIDSASKAVKDVLEAHCEEGSVSVEGGDAISSKLDTTLVNSEWCTTWPEVHTEFMNCGVSDHSPMFIHWTNNAIRRGHSFKFLNHLTLDMNAYEVFYKELLKGENRACSIPDIEIQQGMF